MYYHMSDTLPLGGELTLDYKQQEALALPFAQALQRSEDCFFGMYLNGKYLRAVLGKFGLKDMWSDYVKWAAEGIFEQVRRADYPDCVSRMRCNYFYDNLQDVRKLYEEDWGSASAEERAAIRLYRMELDGVPERRDMLWFDRAYDALWDDDDLATAMDCAYRYFRGEGTERPVWELLSNGKAVAVEDLTEQLRGG